MKQSKFEQILLAKANQQSEYQSNFGTKEPGWYQFLRSYHYLRWLLTHKGDDLYFLMLYLPLCTTVDKNVPVDAITINLVYFR